MGWGMTRTSTSGTAPAPATHPHQGCRAAWYDGCCPLPPADPCGYASDKAHTLKVSPLPPPQKGSWLEVLAFEIRVQKLPSAEKDRRLSHVSVAPNGFHRRLLVVLAQKRTFRGTLFECPMPLRGSGGVGAGTRKRHQQEHWPQRPTECSDPTQHAKGRTGDCPGPRKGATTRRTVTRGGGTVGTPQPPKLAVPRPRDLRGRQSA